MQQLSVVISGCIASEWKSLRVSIPSSSRGWGVCASPASFSTRTHGKLSQLLLLLLLLSGLQLTSHSVSCFNCARHNRQSVPGQPAAGGTLVDQHSVEADKRLVLGFTRVAEGCLGIELEAMAGHATLTKCNSEQ